MYGWPEFFTKTCEDIVLTRGTANAAATRAAKVELDNSKLTNAKSNRIKRSYIPTEMVKVKTSKVSYVNVSEKIQEKYKKQIESLRK